MKQSRALTAFFAVATAVVFAPAALSAQEQQAPPPAVAGAYTLAQVGEAELPSLIGEADGYRREITAATLTLEPDNQWALEAQVRETCGEEVAEKVAKQQGTYTATDQTVTFVAAVELPQLELVWLVWPAALSLLCFGFEVTVARRRPSLTRVAVELPASDTPQPALAWFA